MKKTEFNLQTIKFKVFPLAECLFQRSPTRKPAEGWLSRRSSWFSGKSRAVFRGQVLAVYLIQTVSKFEFKADLFLDLLPPKSVPTT